MILRRVVSIVCMATAFLVPGPGAFGENVPAEYQDVLRYLERSGDYADGVLRVGIPRTDLKVSVANVSTPTSFGFGGWLGFTKGDNGMDVMMGDLVLLQDEVNPVMSALLDHGLEVTALHNHFFWEEPRVFYMHVHGHGSALDLAHRVKPALDLIGQKSSSVVEARPRVERGRGGSDVPANGTLDTQKLNALIGRTGSYDGQVYKVIVDRPDLTVKEMGARINSRMGLNSWAALVGSDDHAAIAGDIAMREEEVTPVVKALRSNGLDVVAIHQHMIGTQPTVIFLHYWGEGPAIKLAAGFKSALMALGKGGISMH